MARPLRIWPRGAGPLGTRALYRRPLFQRVPSGDVPPQTITGAGDIASTEAIGTPQVNVRLFPAAIASSEAIGAVQVNLRIFPSGIATAAGFGTPAIRLSVAPPAIASVGAFGLPLIRISVTPATITSGESVSAPSVRLQAQPAAIASRESFGTPALRVGFAPASVASAEAIGAPTLIYAQTITDAGGITSAEAVGQPTVPSNVAGILRRRRETFIPLPTNPRAAMLAAVGAIASGERFGLPKVSVIRDELALDLNDDGDALLFD